MGTNFYCRHIPTESEQKTMQELLNSRNYKELKELLNTTTEKYHIGKRSAGWQFIFQRSWDYKNNEVFVPWEPTLESIKNYLSKPGIEIFDEYGKYYTPDEFWNEIDNCLYLDEKHTNTDVFYSKKENRDFDNFFEIHETTADDGTRWCYDWFE